ncbi:BlaI/MecI/CopY family transcriptional regulator [Streptomyces griseorubiginosus]|uniref:BlaI/MecI/CopY family transcriptional regulator n=1 Tax=Streptomyces griseorubiginosus TaxID=67304 RepID=UPI0036F13CD2
MNRRLGELELAVMTCIWHLNRSVTVRETLNALTSDKRRAYTTVMTVMDHLYAKGWLSRTRDARAYRYAATTTYAEYSAALMHEDLSVSEAPDREVFTALVALLTPAQRQAISAAVTASSSRA